MIAFLSGTIESLTADTAVIDVGGVGYEVNISAEVSSGLSAVGTGNAVKLYTYTYIREGQVALFGFMSRDDLSLFRQLITVSGIGPKGGLSLLSVLSADDLRFAIVTGDAKMIARAPVGADARFTLSLATIEPPVFQTRSGKSASSLMPPNETFAAEGR